MLFQVTSAQATDPPPAQVPLVADLRQKRSEALERYSKGIPPASAVAPWLLSTGWHLHARDYPNVDLPSLVALPKSTGTDPLRPVVQAVHVLMNRMVALLALMPELVLQYVNSPDANA